MTPFLPHRAVRADAAILVAALAQFPVTEVRAQSADGASVYDRCVACHALARNRTGPRHCGLAGRRAGSVPGFPYSTAMRASGIIWDRRTLDTFLAAPTRFLPGTSMGYDGIKNPTERKALVDWLMSRPPCG